MYRLAIIDDNETWCFVLALQLQQQGYDVSTFTEVPAFLSEANQFDLVLVDFSMPSPRHQYEMDGPDVICHVKNQLDNPPLLILISSFITQDFIDDVADLCPEADAILSKQTEMTEIFAQIRQLLTRKTGPKQRQRHLHPSSIGAESRSRA